MFDDLHLLLVEDEPVTRRRMAEYFCNEGFIVSEATCGSDMKRMLGDRHGPVGGVSVPGFLESTIHKPFSVTSILDSFNSRKSNASASYPA